MALTNKNMKIPKRMQMGKDQATTVGIVAGAVFVTVFSLVSCKALLTQRAYQQKVIDKQDKANTQLVENIDAVNKLVVSYKDFVGAPNNVIGGNPVGLGEKDGDNAKIVLDSLPSKYDFPALASSLEKILLDRKFKIGGITGSDDELTQSGNQTSNNPAPIEIPFSLSVSGSYQSIQGLVDVFEKSIRPFKITKVGFSGSVNEMDFRVDAKTYFQPEKIMEIRTEVVK